MLPELSPKDLVNFTSLNDILTWGSRAFEKYGLYFGHGTDTSWDEALLLALHALDIPYRDDPNLLKRKLTDEEKKRIFMLYHKRVQQRIPAPYLTHTAYFAGHSFYVDERVVIPRSPIAELIENRFAPWIAYEQVHRVLELCTGSACIAIAAAYAFVHARIDAIDLSKDALAVAKINCEKHQVASRIHLKQSDLFSSIENQRYDIIVSNPPYVSASEFARLPAEYHHEPHIGLRADASGLAVVKRILHQSAHYLSKHGILVVEVGYQAEHLAQLYPKVPFTWLEFTRGGEGVFLLSQDQLLTAFKT